MQLITKKARGDHVMKAAGVFSVLLSFAWGFGVLGADVIAALIFSLVVSLIAFLIPVLLVPEELIDDDLPDEFSWRDLFS